MTVRRWMLALVVVLLGGGACASTAQERGALGDPGRQVFMKNGCHGCHVVGAMGTPIGPDLSRIGARRDAAFLERWLRDPASARPRAHMQALELTEADIRILAGYLASLR